MSLLARLRFTEALLLLFPLGCLGAGIGAISVANGGRPEAQLPLLLVMVAAWLLLHLVLVVTCSFGDQIILPTAAMLFALGAMVIGTTSSGALGRQTIWLAAGCVVCAVTASWGGLLDLIRRYRFSIALASIGLVLVTILIGVDPNASGVRLWVGFGEYLFQPSELVKIMMVGFLAAYLDERRELLAMGEYRLGFLRLPPIPYLVPSLVMLGASLLLFLFQRDLGITFLFFGVYMAMLYATSGRGLFLLGGLIALCAGAYLAYRAFPVAHLRVDIWLDPWSDARGRGYQVIQGLVAFAVGGVVGVGPGKGASQLIPAANTDYPFAVIGEELGMIGTLAVVTLYALLASRGIRTAIAHGATYRGLLALGLTTAVCLQALIILAGNLKLVPLTGITLPFVSLGGSSLIVNFAIVGMLLRLSADTPTRAGGT